jgi:hypothetical protein
MILRKANSREMGRYGEKGEQGCSKGVGGDGLEQA